METFAPVSACRFTRMRITTEQPTEFIDLTERIDHYVATTGVLTGLINIQSLHTTAAILLNEHEPLLLTDFAALLERLAPGAETYRHDDRRLRTVNMTPGERINGHAHCRALLLGPSVCLNIVDGHLQLGRWQRLFLVELDGPQPRDLSVLLFGEAGR